MHKPALLAILDGYGLASPGPGNAVTQAETPFLDNLFKTRPFTTIAASGSDVGLPDGQMGNSEVGHLNIGAGRIVNQELLRINNAIADGSFFDNHVMADAVASARDAGGTVHCMGLLSDGGVHSETAHIRAVMTLAARLGAPRIRMHAFLDGRDTPQTAGLGYVRDMVAFCQELSSETGSDVALATVSGRFYAMDRDKRWERLERAWRNLVLADGKAYASAEELVQASYADGVTDEFVVPGFVEGVHEGISDGDAVILCNFRPDRAREITRAFVDSDFPGFERPLVPKVFYVCFTEYDSSIEAPVAFPKSFPEFVLADFLAEEGLRQFHIAETEKYAHVTFFLNGGREEPKKGEQRVLIDSPKDVPTYDLKPQMSAPEVTSRLVSAIESDEADVYIVNYANCDMVGHTGSIPATVKAVEAVDQGIARVIEAIREKGGVALVTADHGNAEKMLEDDGKTPHTAHTCSLVPLCIAAGERTFDGIEDGRLSDIAPTFVDLMGLEIPSAWTGRSLLAH